MFCFKHGPGTFLVIHMGAIAACKPHMRGRWWMLFTSTPERARITHHVGAVSE